MKCVELFAASDGHYQRHFTSDENRGVLRHQPPNAPFFTETVLSDEERRASFGLELLRQAAQSLDLDVGFIWLYVSDLIAPAGTLAKGNYDGGWIDLDDAARRMLGGYAPNIVFPIKDQYGAIVAAQARAVRGSTKLTAGPKKQGAFFAPVQMKSGRVFSPHDRSTPVIAITEAPMDTLSLAESWLSSTGALWNEWS